MPASPSNRAAPTVEPAPDLTTLRSLIAVHASARLAPSRACPDGQTLGAYVDMLVTTGSKDAGEHWVHGGCGPFPATPLAIDPPPDDAYWFCAIDAYANPDGDPWHYELHARVRKDNRELDLATIACPGA